MRIDFQKIKITNFMSVGNESLEIQFDKSFSTLISGKNGNGKSLLTDCISYGLFGKPYRNVNKPQLINSINQKNCLVEIFFKKGNDEYVIERGMKPNVFNILKNGNLINQDAAIKDYQSYLEKNILSLNYKTFKQIVILSSSTFVSFMQLNPSEKRNIVENILGISIFSKMNSILKERYKIIKEEKKDLEPKIENVKTRIKLKSEHIKELSENNQDKIDYSQNKIHKLFEEIKENEKNISIVNDEIEKIKKQIEDISDNHDYEKLKSEIVSKINFLKNYIHDKEKLISFFETKDVCPTCSQDIPEIWKSTKINEINQDKENKNESLEKLQKMLSISENVLKNIKELNEVIWSKYQIITKCNNQIISLQRQISEEDVYKNILIKESKESLEGHIADLKDYKEEYLSLLKNIDEVNKNIRNYEQCIKILDDSGIKTKIIKQYIPLMNKLINEYLKSMNFHVSFHLDEEFNETIKSSYKDRFSYESFSEGEKARIDLALLFTWREICRMRNSVNTNLLLLDEVFDGSLDADARESLLMILETLKNCNVFVITHHPDLLYDKFHSHIEVYKKNGFTKIKG